MAETPVAAARPAAQKPPSAWGAWPPAFYLISGILILLIWLYGNTIQMRTSQVWMFHVLGVTTIPSFDPIKQVGDIMSGNLTSAEIKAYTWGWFVQICLFISALGLSRVHEIVLSKYHGAAKSTAVQTSAHRHKVVFRALCILFFILNCVADFTFDAGSAWGQVLFALIVSMSTYYFGQLSIHLIIAGIEGMRDGNK